MKLINRAESFILVCTMAVFFSGCAGFRQSVVDVDPDNSKAMDSKYDYTDMKTMPDEIAKQILSHPTVAGDDAAPIVAILGIENRTTLHIDTKALADTLMAKLLNSGKLRFVNASKRDQLLKEQNYQAANATKDSQVSIGKQLGAKYMITGAMIELTKQTGRQVRVSKKEERYYRLTVELTDLESGLITMVGSSERARKESQPLIGW
ncbi:MAG: hypothetical protein E4H02_02610 [Lentisphaerales bacterium]|jgi:uncharacterized protein (TIGR02722 family)|nr:MAG: hypothetical protein E4H02_02610 [Lentisphaerales bacterium]